MENKKYLLLTISSIFVLVLGLFTIYILAFGHKDEEPAPGSDNPSDSEQIDDNGGLDENDFTLTTNYLGDSKWSYNVTTQLPNPCYSAIVSEIVRESFPEQVSVNVDVKYDSESICTQQIIDFDYDGTFSASEEAIVNLVVN